MKIGDLVKFVKPINRFTIQEKKTKSIAIISKKIDSEYNCSMFFVKLILEKDNREYGPFLEFEISKIV